MKVKKKVTETVERKVAALLLQDPQFSARYLKREAEKALKKEGKSYNFTERTYSTIKKRILPNISPDDPLDQKWSIGICEENNIPDYMIPLIIEKIKLFDIIREYLGSSWQGHPHDDDGWLEIEWPPISIRMARWMSRLKSAVDMLIDEYKNLKPEPPRTNKERDSIIYWLLYNIAQVYARTERINSSLGNTYFDTSETDKLYFLTDYETAFDLQKELEKAEKTLRWGFKLGDNIGDILIDDTLSGAIEREKIWNEAEALSNSRPIRRSLKAR